MTDSTFKLPCRKCGRVESCWKTRWVKRSIRDLMRAEQVDRLQAAESQSVSAETFISACYDELHRIATKKRDRGTLKKITDILAKGGGNQRLLGKAKTSYDDQLYRKAMKSKDVEAQLDFLANCQICDANQKARIERRRDKFKARDQDQGYREAIRQRGLSNDEKYKIGTAFLQSCFGLPCKRTGSAIKSLVQGQRKEKSRLNDLQNLCSRAKDKGSRWCTARVERSIKKHLKTIQKKEEAAKKRRYANLSACPNASRETEKVRIPTTKTGAIPIRKSIA